MDGDQAVFNFLCDNKPIIASRVIIMSVIKIRSTRKFVLSPLFVIHL